MINGEFVKGLKHFFEQWKTIQTQLVVEPNIKKKELVIPNIEELEKFFNIYQQVNQIREKERRMGTEINVWQAANLGRYEVRNSKTLCCFLDCNADHGQKDAFLKAFLSCINLGYLNTEKYLTTEESCPIGEQSERVDIEVESDNFLLFIEVKIDAFEGEEQLNRYYDVATKKSNARFWRVIYLTKDGVLPDKEKQNNERFIGMSWKTLATAFQQLAKQEPDNRVYWLAQQFAQHILTF